jgi:hypothetical protein
MTHTLHGGFARSGVAQDLPAVLTLKEIFMKKALIVAATLFAVPAFAQTSTTGGAAVGTTGSLTITTDQEARLGQIIQRNPVRRAGETSFTVGATLPAEVELQTLPQEFVTEVPTVSTYRYVATNGGIALVDPSSRRVVRVIQSR